MQNDLHQRIQYFTKKAKKLDLPLVKDELTPIFFIGVGESAVGFEMCRKIMEDGFYVNVAAFPSVPYNKAGLRMTVTRHQTFEDIDRLLSTISLRMDEVLDKANYRRDDIFKTFKMDRPAEPAVRVRAAVR